MSDKTVLWKRPIYRYKPQDKNFVQILIVNIYWSSSNRLNWLKKPVKLILVMLSRHLTNLLMLGIYSKCMLLFNTCTLTQDQSVITNSIIRMVTQLYIYSSPVWYKYCSQPWGGYRWILGRLVYDILTVGGKSSLC